MKSYKQVFEEYAKSQPDYEGNQAYLEEVFNDPFFADLEIIAENFAKQYEHATNRTGTEPATK